MDYNEKAKELNILLRIIDSTILALSLGIVAYSFNNFNNDIEYKYLMLLYISWASLTISFFTTLIRFHHHVRILGRNAFEQLEVERHNKKVEINEERIRKTNIKSALLYRVMLIAFCFGVVLYGLFKIINF